MCLYPKLIINKKYRPTKKNGYNAPQLTDERVKYVPVGCGHCLECVRKKANGWKIRLFEEYKSDQNTQFVTLTFSNEELTKICEKIGKGESNAVATYAVRHFLERWRKKYKVSVKHWLITELGHKNTERLHLHGIIWTKEPIEPIWQYGGVYIGKYVNQATINYIIKYITKIDKDHKGYQPIILCSKGIGKGYTESKAAEYNRYKEKEETNEKYRTRQGTKLGLPIYYRNHIYTEEQRELLWLQKLDKGERWINGVKVNANDLDEVERQLKAGQELNKRLGYGSNETKQINYNARLIELKELKEIKQEAIKQANGDEKEYQKIYNKLKQKRFPYL